MTNNYNFIGRLVAIVAIATLITVVSVVIWIPKDALPILVPTFGFAVAITGIIINLKQSADNGAAQLATAVRVETIQSKVAAVEEKTLETAVMVAQTATEIATNTQITQGTHLAVNSRMDQLIEKVEAQGKAQEELAAALAMAQGITIGRAQAQSEASETPQ